MTASQRERDEQAGTPTWSPETGLWSQSDGDLVWHWAPGAISSVENQDENGKSIGFPPGALRIHGEPPRFSLPGNTTPLPGLGVLHFLPSPARTTLSATVDGDLVGLIATDAPESPERAWSRLLDGDRALARQDELDAAFPQRTPGHANYWPAIDHFQSFLTDLGYDVATDPYGTRATAGLACVPDPMLRPCADSLANIVATKHGSGSPQSVFVAGAHFDHYEDSPYSAYDNTAGTVQVLTLAEAIAPYGFDLSLRLGLWGGEEDGHLGSRAWAEGHPDAIANQASYWNLDATAAGWPAPLAAPEPWILSVGPDVAGPAGPADEGTQAWLQWLDWLAHDWIGYPENYTGPDGIERPTFQIQGMYSATAEEPGQRGFTLLSDHTSFASSGQWAVGMISRGIDAYPPGNHNPDDTTENLMRFALYGREAVFEDGWWYDLGDEQEARAALTQSYEVAMWLPFYHAVLVDLGVWSWPVQGVPGSALAAAPVGATLEAIA